MGAKRIYVFTPLRFFPVFRHGHKHTYPLPPVDGFRGSLLSFDRGPRRPNLCSAGHTPFFWWEDT